jgi:tRNA G10  N-methylase Trm11
VDEKLRRKAEAFIAARSGLRVNRTGPDTEFWFLYRREGCSLFMRRLSKHPTAEKTRRRGELAPQLAYMMCWLSSPKKTDIVADPFCGYGSIPQQRLRHFPLERFYAFDLDEKALDITRGNLGSAALRSCVVRKAEVRSILPLLPEAGVDAIITDPPWGLYAKTAQAPDVFYRGMIDIFGRALKNGGICVILTARKDEMLLAAAASEWLTITSTIPVLVSGKKAGIFILRKGRKDPGPDPDGADPPPQ